MTGVMTLSAKAAMEMSPDIRNSRQIYLYGSSKVRILITTHMGYQVIPSDSLEGPWPGCLHVWTQFAEGKINRVIRVEGNLECEVTPRKVSEIRCIELGNLKRGGVGT
jgi:hypothetical protein